jgi:hypothetical protein
VSKFTKTIHQHEGNKYLRVIHSAEPVITVEDDTVTTEPSADAVRVDVYEVLEAFGVTCPGRQQAVKKLLCAGIRGKGDELADLLGAEAALSRAIELQRRRDRKAAGEKRRVEKDVAAVARTFNPDSDLHSDLVSGARARRNKK